MQDILKTNAVMHWLAVLPKVEIFRQTLAAVTDRHG